MFLVVSGNVNPYEIEKIVNNNLSTKNIIEYLEPEITKTKESKRVVVKERFIPANVEVAKAKVGLKIPIKDFKNVDKIKLSLMLSIVLNSNFGDTSDLKEELLQDGLITYLSSNRYVMDDFVIIDITIESNYVDEAIKKIINALNNLKIDKEDLKRKINSSVATLVLNYEDVEQVNGMIQNNIIYYDRIVDNLKEIYESVTMDDINGIIEAINTKEMTIVKMDKAI